MPVACVQQHDGAPLKMVERDDNLKQGRVLQVRTALQTRAGKGLCVTFDEERNEAYPSLHADKESCVECWYCSEDYREFKRCNQKNASEIIKGRKSHRRNGMIWRQALERTYKVLVEETFLEDEYNDEHDEFDFETSLLTAVEQKHLRSVYAGSALSLGLEHQIVDLIGNERHNRLMGQAESVYQAEMAIEFHCPDFKREFIRFACERISLAPRLFSREVALALAAEVHGLEKFPSFDDSSQSSDSSYPKGF
mmetsp:Transcript_9090/g.19614  ORF Transcript_9090/g.19614 Transcript_9090/m.19614 type:complete len:252 (-) Transcript_9090:91-846(-)|eukprot:CAMPEP_0168762566 /NCGR_PEP_ID=MMETSP0724-20121128/23907_1 /TAXON_ID=265536 /ORGANISM="Amphiprora sp., Strain CCMP467" /LENGTH=251 /DNA_ID=CAMNT_0008811729 /DNA_START=164 /DNA_END=919 /DNA_ORIENTATION=-